MDSRSSTLSHSATLGPPTRSLAAAMVRAYFVFVVLSALAVASFLYTVVETEGLAGNDLADIVDYTLTVFLGFDVDAPRMWLEWGAFVVPLLLAFPSMLALLPAINAFRRRHRSRFFILLLNLLGGWSILFWVIAMIWSAWTMDDLRQRLAKRAQAFKVADKASGDLPPWAANALEKANSLPWAADGKSATISTSSPVEVKSRPARERRANPVPQSTAPQSDPVVRRRGGGFFGRNR